ncbi:DedA family protein [Allorhodopirellula heiligendammensis]|uniref:Inner membrane protein YqjA n=1 Tax=Allorhodopirellula heiligendammensis TaxID=2714739 RepID=A0A5C6C4I9_9BACT|nr:DedA family protein [Allorhodopirellula heiligendammensis]TWU18386.1 Inner membrane protein YqjA [Allorhodopirellula heiligendammensis]
MDDWITSFLEQFGSIGVGALMLIENVFPPIPSEVVMPWAGYSVSRGDASFTLVVVAGSAGSLVGAMFWYYLAKWVGKERLSRWIDGHGAWLTITPRDLDRMDEWFERYGSAAVLVCRMIPGVRTLISIPAGFSEMPLVPFLIFTAIGTVLWTALLAGLGWWLGDNYGDLSGPLGWASTAVVVGLFAWWLLRLVRQYSSHAVGMEVAKERPSGSEERSD